jgi:hypothetical protein
MTNDFLDGVMERYAFADWPKESRRRSAEPKHVLIDKSSFSGFTLVRRDSVGKPHSYEDLYVSDASDDARVHIRVVNAGSFAEAKDGLMQRLAECANPRIDDWAPDDLPVDVGFAAVNEGLRAAMFVCGNTFVEISSVGLEDVNLQGFVSALKDQL